MKKKVLTVAFVVVLIAVTVSGSLAYFTDTDSVDNVFTVGSVKIEIFENGEETVCDTISFGSLIPVVRDTPSQDVNYIKKVVNVKNTGKNDAYIRTHIAMPTALINYLQLDLNTKGWTINPFGSATVDGVAYTVFTYDHMNAVAPGEFTAELLQGLYLRSNVDLEEDASGNLVYILRDEGGDKTASLGFVAHTKNADGSYTSAKINILIAAEAIQTSGFENGATDALNSGFGENTNPWQ